MIANQVPVGPGPVISIKNPKIGNSVSSTESDLFSTTLPAKTFGSTGGWMELNYMVTVKGTGGTNKVLRLYLAASKIFDSGNLSPLSDTTYNLSFKIFKNGSSYQVNAMLVGVSSGMMSGVVSYTATSITEATGMILKLTGQSSGGSPASGDVTVPGDYATALVCGGY